MDFNIFQLIDGQDTYSILLTLGSLNKSVNTWCIIQIFTKTEKNVKEEFRLIMDLCSQIELNHGVPNSLHKIDVLRIQIFRKYNLNIKFIEMRWSIILQKFSLDIELYLESLLRLSHWIPTKRITFMH